MLALLLLRLLIFVLMVIGFWYFIGRPLVNWLSNSTDVRADKGLETNSLRRKIKALEDARRELAALQQELDITSDLLKLDAELQKCRTRLAELERAV